MNEEEDGSGSSSSTSYSGKVLSSQYDVVKTIFRHLPAADLRRVSAVCRLWRDISKIVRASRLSIEAFSWTGAPCKEGQDVFRSGSIRRFRKDYESFINNLFSEPKIVISVNTSDYDQIYSDSEEEEVSYPYDLSSLVPSTETSVTYFGSTYGIVTSDREIEIRKGITPAVSLFTIPDFPGVEIYPFEIPEMDECHGIIGRDDDDISFIEEYIPDLPENVEIKGLIIFTHADELYTTPKIIKECAIRAGSSKFALGGSIGHLTFVSSPDKKLNYSEILEYYNDADARTICTSGLLFTGPKVRMKSIVLSSAVTTEKKVEKELQKLKPFEVVESRCCAFMFACCGRGKGLYNKKDVESKVFRKLFPKIPLMGSFCGGEIGLNSREDDDSDGPSPEKILKWTYDDYLHSYTTVFVLCAFDK